MTTAYLSDQDQPEGIHFDDASRLRVLNIETFQETVALQDECEKFISNIGGFQDIAAGFIDLVKTLATSVEEAKMRAIGLRCELESVSKARVAEKARLKALLSDQQSKLERYKTQYMDLKRIEEEQMQGGPLDA